MDKGVGLRHRHTQDHQESWFNSWFPRPCLEVQHQYGGLGLGSTFFFFLKMDCWTQKGNTSKQTNKASRAAPRGGKPGPWGLCSRLCFLRCGFHSTVCLVGKGGKGTSKLLCLQATGSILWSHSCEQSVATWVVRHKWAAETREGEAQQLLGERT